MDSLTYQKEAVRTASGQPSFEEVPIDLLHAAIGACTESGEFVDALKKAIFYGKPLDRINLIEELGDILWYLALACETLDTNFSEVMYKNIAKLRVRYPEKFTAEAAINRNVKKELQAFG